MCPACVLLHIGMFVAILDKWAKQLCPHGWSINFLLEVLFALPCVLGFCNRANKS